MLIKFKRIQFLIFLLLCSSLSASFWEPPQVISGANASDVDIACDANGNVVAVWQQGSDILSAYRPAGGLWESPILISDVGKNNDEPSVCIDGNGTLTAVWINTSDNLVQSAQRPLGGSWSASSLVANGGVYSDLTIDCIANGRVAASWFNSAAPSVEACFRETDFSWGVFMAVASGADIVATSNPIIQFLPDNRARIAYVSTGTGLNVALGKYNAVPFAWLSAPATGGGPLPPPVVFDFALNDSGQGVIAINSGAAPQPIQAVLVALGAPVPATLVQISPGNGKTPRVGIDNNGIATVVWADADGTIKSAVTTVTAPIPSNIWNVATVSSGPDDVLPRMAVSSNGGMAIQWFAASATPRDAMVKIGFGGTFEPTAVAISSPNKPGDMCVSNNGTAFGAWQLSQGGQPYIETSMTIPGPNLIQGLQGQKRVIFQRGILH